MGLAEKSMELTEDIHKYLKDISTLKDFLTLSFLIIKGNMLVSRIKLLMEDLDTAADDKEIMLTALQIKKALEIELTGLEDVISSLKTADQMTILSKQALLEAQIREIKEKI